MSTTVANTTDESQYSTIEAQGIVMEDHDAQAVGSHKDEMQVMEEGGQKNGDKDAPPSEKKLQKKEREKKEPTVLTREPGKSLLPFSRVQKIIKADKDIPIVAKDATFLISLATEEFIKRLSEYSQSVAEREKRATVQHRDIATVVRKEDEFLFLEEMIPWTAPVAAPKRSGPKNDESKENAPVSPTMLDQFLKREITTSDVVEDEDVGEDIVMNDDGTMTAV